ncbi:A24 family peptidase [Bacillus massilinigeriensis]|uniref:A24 family peptidase n=1 Tax=Bacillus massilionigeriensis TaxID=1805475 RepID=UPI00096B34AB|nr:A24 family peptidase [Bacillus massilionigeriensis]
MDNFILLIALVISFVTDLRKRKIYNIITFPSIILGFVFHTWMNGFQGFLFSLFGCIVGLGLLMFPFILGAMGAGDVKLLAAIGALKGTFFVIQTFVVMAIFGGIIALLILLTKKEFHPFYQKLIVSISIGKWHSFNKDDSQIVFPYGVAIVLGTLINVGVELF